MKEGDIIQTCKKRVGDKIFLKIYKRKKTENFRSIYYLKFFNKFSIVSRFLESKVSL